MRPRALLAGVTLAVLLAGCSPGSGPGGTPSTASPPPGGAPAASSAGPSSQPGPGLAATVAAMRRAGTVSADYRLDVLDVGVVRGTGALGLDGTAAGDWSAVVPDEAGVPRAVRLLAVDGAAYARPAGLTLPPGVTWVGLPGGDPGAGRALVGLADRLRLVTDPVALLALAPAVATPAGRPAPVPAPVPAAVPAPVPGSVATRYELVIPLADATATADPALDRELQRMRAAGGRELRVTVWVGADGLPLRVTTSADGRGELRSEATYSGWGTSPRPVGPAAGAVVPLASVLAAP